MPLQATFTTHSMYRVRQRSKLDMSVIAALLDSGNYVAIWNRPGSFRHAKLIYSVADEVHYIIIQHEMSGEVVTVLYADSHSFFTGLITDKMRATTKKMAIDLNHASIHGASTAPTLFVVKIQYFDDGGLLKTKKIMSVQRSQFGGSVDRMVNDSKFIKDLLERIALLQVSTHDAVVMFGDANPKHVAIFISYSDLARSQGK